VLEAGEIVVSMAQLIDFLVAQWMLVAALMVCIGLLLRHESLKGGEALTPQQVISLINQQQAVVVDLREAKEFQQGHIVNAINIPHAKLASRIDELQSHKGKPIVLACKLGQHSGAAGKQLATAGYEQVSRLKGGMAEWQSSQLPLVS
jgi:rhodanese-related sulfurtransferase